MDGLPLLQCDADADCWAFSVCIGSDGPDDQIILEEGFGRLAEEGWKTRKRQKTGGRGSFSPWGTLV